MRENNHHRLDVAGVSLVLDLTNGHIAALDVEAEGRVLHPLHRAPWIDSGENLPENTPSGLARLSGDFFCAPFGRNDVEDAPGHGWTANAPWSLLSDERIDGGRVATFRLSRPVFGATVEKRITLRDNHPFIYQEHRLIGGQGGVSVSHHLMTHMQAGGLLGFSPKRFALTPDTSLEPDPARGRFVLAYPAQADLTAFPLERGGTTDLRIYPPAERHEDFLTLAEAEGASLGWTTISRHAERDMLIVLKQPDVLPVTMLWMSNGGRDYAPWNSRHIGVLGIEDARASASGHAASLGENALTQQGIPTAFPLGQGDVIVRQTFGVTPLADTHNPVQSVRAGDNKLTVIFQDGEQLSLPYDASFLG
ncbi:hypothetical protein JYU29_14650 [Tianweitania sp. BSSL-BM11]|uniref:DUF4432 domain-containing protein n=1 Tax=Tianweitania aestuarii TaxID=2814886 RepID=A0ABS5RY05_9HYPH|nr:hypothetical protein [Tianweitania aestuarii]MBS9721928.1 hypothetical protein [Tianweitania aestuarii]